MQIASISSMAPIGQQTILSNTAATNTSKSISSVSATASSTTATTAAASTTSTTSTTSSSRSSSGGGGGGGASAASSTAETLAAVYSTTVDGKSYSGSVEKTNGEYTASVANLPGASASGSSVASAENALGIIISVLA
jgi:hypothetical protein